MLDRAGLARKATALDGADDVILANAIGYAEGLVDDEAQGRTREVDFLVAAVDGDLAGAGLHPDAGDRVLAATGCVGAAVLVELLLAQRRGALGNDGGVRFGSIARDIAEIGTVDPYLGGYEGRLIDLRQQPAQRLL